MAAAATRKRRAPDEPSSSATDKKSSRYSFRSIRDYEKLEVLGEGTYGVVAKARHLPSGDTVAIKWFRRVDRDKPYVRAVVREAGCLAACRGHPCVVQIRDVAADEATGDLFLVTELVDGPCLRDRLTRRFTEAETRAFVRQLLRGLEGIHGAGAIHRDVKPENVLVGPGGALKICDFGMATPVRPPYREECVGSLWYRSPEQLMGSRCYGTTVDVWALGCVMAELLTGEPLFVHVDTEDDMLMEVLHLRHEIESEGLQAIRGLPELSQDAGEVLLGLLCFDEDQRLTAAEALRHRWFCPDEEASSSIVAEEESPAVSGAEHTQSQRLTAADAIRHRWFAQDEEAESPAVAEAESPAVSEEEFSAEAESPAVSEEEFFAEAESPAVSEAESSAESESPAVSEEESSAVSEAEQPQE